MPRHPFEMFRLGLSSLLLCAFARGSELNAAPDTIEARAQGCSTCHGAQGEGTLDPAFPRIAGKPAGYLLNQMRNFRDGQRSYPPMNYLLAYMHDDYMTELAAYFAMQPAARRVASEASPSTDVAAVATAGAHLVQQGDAAAGVPACILCHGTRLNGMQPGIPGLIGLNSRYIAAQLVSWQVGTRQATQPDCMRLIASRLTTSQIRQAAAWLASQPSDSQLPPAAAGSWATPIACGSEP